MVTGGVPVVEWLIAQPMSKGVDAKCSLLHKEDAQDAGVDKSSKIISPSKTCNEAWEYHTHKSKHFKVMSMLPDDNRVFIEIRNISPPNSFWVLLHYHPAEVGVEESLADAIWVLVCVGITMMSTVVTSPCLYQSESQSCIMKQHTPAHRSLNRSSANSGQEYSQRQGG